MKLRSLKSQVRPLHEAKQGGWSATRTETAAKRGYGYAWQKLRERVLIRDCGLCQTCKRQGILTLANIVDHIVPKFEGGKDVDDNAEVICKPHHVAKTAEESARAQGWGRGGQSLRGPAR